MADDNYQRPFGGDRYGRGAPRPTSNNDPLAELARLIGQNDPFAEFGRAPQPQPKPVPAAPQWAPAASRSDYPAAPVPGYEQGVHDDMHGTYAQPQPGYEAAAPSFDQNYQDDGRYSYESGQGASSEDAYDDVPPRRSRLGIIVIACVVMLAVVGTAGAFGYRALFGSSGSKPPPVIQADAGPSKVVPPNRSEPSGSKQFNDRVGERSAGEKLVSREEQPMERPQPPAFPVPSVAQQAAAMPQVAPVQNAAEPKKIRTIAIKPDGSVGESAMPTSTPARATSPTPQATPTPAPPPQRVASAPPVAATDAEEAAPRPAPARSAPSRNAPLSLNPETPARSEPVRTASAPPRAAPEATATASAQYGVQVTSQRSEAEAQSAYRALQAKFPSQLGGHAPLIRRADLGDKGTFYRALVPFSNGADALALCNSLKAAGGACIIQKN
jgi:hypothetical protein